VSVVDVSKMLGHADPSITLRVYAHAMPGSAEQVAAVMEQILRRPPSADVGHAQEQ
jgi:integrase